MGDLKLLLLIVLPAIALACIVGVVFGKHQLKKASGQLRPLLTPKQRILYSVSIAMGVTCLLIGFLYNPASEGMEEGMYDELGMMEGDMEGMGELNPGAAELDEGVVAGKELLPDETGEGSAAEESADGENLEGEETGGETSADGESVPEEDTASDRASTTDSAVVQAAPAAPSARSSARIGGGSGRVVIVG